MIKIAPPIPEVSGGAFVSFKTQSTHQQHLFGGDHLIAIAHDHIVQAIFAILTCSGTSVPSQTVRTWHLTAACKRHHLLSESVKNLDREGIGFSLEVVVDVQTVTERIGAHYKAAQIACLFHACQNRAFNRHRRKCLIVTTHYCRCCSIDSFDKDVAAGIVLAREASIRAAKHQTQRIGCGAWLVEIGGWNHRDTPFIVAFKRHQANPVVQAPIAHDILPDVGALMTNGIGAKLRIR